MEPEGEKKKKEERNALFSVGRRKEKTARKGNEVDEGKKRKRKGGKALF